MKTTRAHLFRIGVGAFLSFSPLFVGNASASALKCSAIFAYQVSPMTKEQINQAILELSALRLNLDKAQAQGARSITSGFLQKEFDQKYLALVSYVEKNQLMTRAELVEKLQKEIALLQQDPEKTDNAPETAKHIKHLQEIVDRHHGQKMIPQRVEAGEYKEYLSGKRIPIKKPFEMMSTPTTQIVWRKVVHLLDKNLPGGYRVQADPADNINDLHPVKNVSRLDVYVWLEGLNQLSQKGEPALADIIEGHKTGDQYRLPFEKEWEYVLYSQDRFEIDRQIDQYAWHAYSGKNGTQPVALKLPIIKDGKKFYDLLGNISEMMQGEVGQTIGKQSIITRGGNHVDEPGDLYSRDFDLLPHLSYRSEYVGFRMVRDVPSSPLTTQPKTSLWKKITGKLGW